MTRQLGEIIGRVQRGLPRLNRAPVTGWLANWRVVGRLAFLVLTLALTVVSACVVTENKDFVGATSPPIPVATSPPRLTRVPLLGDADCTGAPSMQFEATVLDLDVESQLYALLFVNGEPSTAQILYKTGKTTRSFSQCLPYSSLGAPCSIVELVVSNDPYAVFSPPHDAVLDPSAKFGPPVSWTILGPASGDQADAKWSDCRPDLQPDGGV